MSSIDHLLHRYRLRLTNLSQRNPTLRLGRLTQRRTLDWKQFALATGGNADALLQRAIAGRSITMVPQLDPRFPSANRFDRQLNTLYRSLQTLFEETGTYDLYLGYPFVEGAFLDGTHCRAPLVLLPARLHRKLRGRPRWKLEMLTDEAITFNRTFFLAYEQFQRTQLSPEFWEIELAYLPDPKQWLNAVYGHLKSFDIALNFNPRLFDSPLESAPDFLKADFEKFQAGVLRCQPQAVLGIFPQSDTALLQDYDKIEAQPEAFGLADWFERIEKPPGTNTHPPVREEDRFFVTEVDQTQESALLALQGGDSLVLHGPPGTGKSQVIVNAVADALAHGRRVLVVSQKRAALDVVFERLEALGLGDFAQLVHDLRHDRNPIFRKLRRQIEQFDTYRSEQNNLHLTQLEHSYRRLSREIDQQSRRYDRLYGALTSDQRHGIAPHDLYRRSKPDAAPFVLPATADWTDKQLDHFLERLQNLLDYAELLDPAHPWAKRTSWHEVDYAEGERLRGAIEALPFELGDLYELYQPLRNRIGKESFEPEELQRKLEAFEAFFQLHFADSTQQDQLALWVGLGVPPPLIAGQLDQLQKLLEAQKKGLDLLRDFPARLYAKLEEQLENFAWGRRKPSRRIGWKFLRARWFLKRLLPPNESLGLESFGQLKREFELLRDVRRWYTKHYESPLFQDYPLLESSDEQFSWLASKRSQLDLFRRFADWASFPGWRPILGKNGWDAGAFAASQAEARQLSRLLNRYRDQKMAWTARFGREVARQLLATFRSKKKIDTLQRALTDSFARDFEALREVDRQLQRFSAGERATVDRILANRFPLDPARKKIDPLLARVRNSIYLGWLESLERQQPELAEVSLRGWPRTRENYLRRYDERRQTVARLVRRRLETAVVEGTVYNRLGNPITYRGIEHQVSKKRRLWSLRRLVHSFWREGLATLAPCWLASPESAAALFPLQRDFFDLVIFDEASQCFAERGLPVLLRGRQVMVAGDEQQLQPTHLYRVRYDEGEAEDETIAPTLEAESLLDLARSYLPTHPLAWHYRSSDARLIHFSNVAYYDGRLQVVPPPRRDPAYQPPMRWIAVEGNWERNVNRIEAERVVDVLVEMAQRADPPSLGVVTFNYPQQEAIKDVLDARLEFLGESNPEIYQKLQAALNRKSSESFEGIFVKNIENVQGDERDVIVFSPAYAPDATGRIAARFGSLNQADGIHRLNVAITRARHQEIVVCSFNPDLLAVEATRHEGPRHFRDWLRYARAVGEGHELPLTGGQPTTVPVAPNPLADELAEALAARGWTVGRNLGTTAYRVEIALKARPDDPAWALGLEVEGPQLFAGGSNKAREIYRPNLLRRRGWRLYRVWARNWWRDRAGELARIEENFNI